MEREGGNVMYLQGRIAATTYEQAVEEVWRVVADTGCVPAGEIKPWPCSQTQGVIWWEYLVKIEKKGDLRWLTLNILRKLKNWRAR